MTCWLLPWSRGNAWRPCPRALWWPHAICCACAHHTLDEQLDLERDIQSRLGFTHDYIEGVCAFLEKRTPDFKDECMVSGAGPDPFGLGG